MPDKLPRSTCASGINEGACQVTACGSERTRTAVRPSNPLPQPARRRQERRSSRHWTGATCRTTPNPAPALARPVLGAFISSIWKRVRVVGGERGAGRVGAVVLDDAVSVARACACHAPCRGGHRVAWLLVSWSGLQGRLRPGRLSTNRPCRPLLVPGIAGASWTGGTAVGTARRSAAAAAALAAGGLACPSCQGGRLGPGGPRGTRGGHRRDGRPP